MIAMDWVKVFPVRAKNATILEHLLLTYCLGYRVVGKSGDVRNDH